MNEVIKQLHARKSVRVFEDREIPADAKAAILAEVEKELIRCEQSQKE